MMRKMPWVRQAGSVFNSFIEVVWRRVIKTKTPPSLGGWSAYFGERHTTRGEDFVMDHSGGEVTFRYFRLV